MLPVTKSQEKAMKAWLHDLFVWGGIVTQPKRTIPPRDYRFMYGNNNSMRNNYNSELKTICDAILFRFADGNKFIDLDNALKELSDEPFNPDLASDSLRKHIQFTPEMLANAIAWFCANNELYWSDANLSTYEMDEIKNDSILGKALWEANCFVSQEDPKASTSAKAKRAASTGGQGNPPKNDYKSRGPLSGQAIGLIGQPGFKTPILGDIFAINGVDSDTQAILEQTAYIRPVDGARFDAGNNKCKVLYGSAKGYGYCQVYFDDPQKADAFMQAMKNAGTTSVELKVTKKKAGKNGYFEIDTEFGPVFISAEKLNEEVQEELEIPTTKNCKAKTTARDRFEAFEDAFLYKN